MIQSQHLDTKKLFDKFFSIFLFILLFPLLGIVSLLIILDDGNKVFFRQKRPGYLQQPFNMWKFRTMVPNADRFLNLNGSVNGKNRITHIGKFLRFSSFDELPQLINIMKGEMSFVGPRPGLYEHLERYTDEQKKRFLMKPGITGLAQINGRNTIKWSKRIEFDLEYINNYSILLDLTILLKTLKLIILHEGVVLDRNAAEIDDLNKI